MKNGIHNEGRLAVVRSKAPVLRSHELPDGEWPWMVTVMVVASKAGMKIPILFLTGFSVIGRLVDPPLNALSWNLKDSHVFSGSFLYIKMKEKN